ncbi:PmrA [Streptomyces microflavus]|uniref:PmrA n=1 Tax=Streptomyces microflavus TaxID=1919 RepID=UPI00332446DF
MTYDAEDDTSPPMLPARSRHASVCSLERYAPGLGSAAPHVAELDPAPRRRT